MSYMILEIVEPSCHWKRRKLNLGKESSLVRHGKQRRLGGGLIVKVLVYHLEDIYKSCETKLSSEMGLRIRELK